MSFPGSPAALLQELIRIPSVNPDCAVGQGATGEWACSVRVGEILEACGARVTFDEVMPGTQRSRRSHRGHGAMKALSL